MIKRIQLYIREMFPLKIYVPFAFLNHYILFFTAQLYLNVNQPILSFYSLIGVTTIIGFLLIMRVFDELKDEEVDKRLFAHRALPRGDVKKSDLVILALTTFVLVAVINSFRNYTLPFFLLCVVYAFLTFKWFFFKRIISTNLLLAFVTHQPLAVLINVYVASTAMVQVAHHHWNIVMFALCIIFFLPVMAWEISRKIKPINSENDYVTYSKIFGPRLAAFLNFLILILFLTAIIVIGQRLGFNNAHVAIQLLMIMFVIFVYVRFMIHPIRKNLILKPVTEVLTSLATFVYLFFMISKYGMHFTWF